MTPPNAPSTGPREAPPEETKRTEELSQIIERLEAKFPSHGARMRAAANLPAGTANGICKQECIQINEEYGELVRARVERFMLSGKVEELEQQWNELNRNNATAFTATEVTTIRQVMALLYPNKKGQSQITQKFPHGDKEISRVRVAVLDGHIKTLRGIQGLRPGQESFVQNLTTTLENIKAMDPFASQLLEVRKEQQKPSKTMQAIKPQLRLYAMLITAGAALLSLISNKGRPSFPFALYAGLTYLLYNGLPKGKQASLNKQLTFLPDTNEHHTALNQLRPLSETWYIELAQKYNIKGDDWTAITGQLMSRSGRDMLQKVRKVLLNKKSTEEERKKKLDELTKGFAPHESNAAHQSFRTLVANQDDFIKFSYLVLQVRDRGAQHIFTENIRQGMNPRMWEQT